MDDSFRLSNYIHNQHLAEMDNSVFEDREIYDTNISDLMNFELESQFLPIDESVEDPGMFNYGEYSDEDVAEAKEWSRTTGIPIIYPVSTLKELETLKDNFDSYFESIRKVSDSKSIEFFGMNNDRHYELLKSNFIKNDIAVDEFSVIGDAINSHYSFILNEELDTATRARDLLMLSSRITVNESYENTIMKDIVDKTTKEYIASHQNINYDVVNGEDLPFYTPDELIDLGVYTANAETNDGELISRIITDTISEDTNISDWFVNYANNCAGLDTGYDPYKWKNTVELLKFKRDRSTDKELYDKALISMGWPPEAEFSAKNRVIATKRIKSHFNKGSSQFVDLTGFTTESTIEDLGKENNILFPVYIVLEEGSSIVSKSIKKFTHSVFSHTAIGFDSSLKELYSFNGAARDKIIGNKNNFEKMIGGLVKESIDDLKDNSHLAVYAIFLKEKDYIKIRENLDFFIHNGNKTRYGYSNLILSHIFHIPLDKPFTMVCSEFVDKLLKLSDIDISNKNSSLISPGDLERFSKKNKKIYVLFDDIRSKYSEKRVKNIINNLIHKAIPIKEFKYNLKDRFYIINETITNIRYLDRLKELSYYIKSINDPNINKIFESMIEPCLSAECYFDEAVDAFIQFDKEGNMFIKNIKKKDYETEYSKSHKLLRQYEKANNIEGIKYELCKLWFMNSVIESNIHKKGNVNHDNELKNRAKILNDFNHFLGVVLEKEPRFNFQEYFESSPYNDALIKVNRDTIIWSGRLFKMILDNI